MRRHGTRSPRRRDAAMLASRRHGARAAAAAPTAAATATATTTGTATIGVTTIVGA
ncbi:hypothetical protein [Halopenitus persicus]|uniref:hypothetical protein n=1 Tax=Halopenitus persicus TaxID=1048396 RepID=UPI0015A4416F|nr:hypothetical protein [Halopenitus persicus]